MERTIEEKSEGTGKVTAMLKQKLQINDSEQELPQDQPGTTAQFKYKLCIVQFNTSGHTSGKQFQVHMDWKMPVVPTQCGRSSLL